MIRHLRITFLTLILLLALSISAALISFGATTSAGFSNDYAKYTHNERFKDAIVVNGIDISAWQDDISESTFKKMKAKGIDFVILRLGYTGSASFKPTIDSCFETNYANAKSAGMEIGIYYYSLATRKYAATTKPKVKKWVSAEEEANFVIKHLKGKEVTYPIFMDVEDNANQAPLTKAKLAGVANYFCSLIEKANPDYEAGVYANLSWLHNQIGTINSSYDIWVAQYYNMCLFEKPYIMWQYSSSGHLSCFNGRLDMNFRYLDDSISTSKRSLSTATVNLSYKSCTYSSGQKKPVPTVTLGESTLTLGTDYTVAYYRNVKAGKGYVVINGKGKYTDCKIVPFTIKKKSITYYEIGDIKDQKYNNKGCKPSVVVTNKSTGNTLSTSYYTVSYSENKKVGTATVTVTGQDNYKDAISREFKITTLTPTITVKDEIVKNGKYTFPLNAKTDGDGKLKYKSKDKNVATVDEDGIVRTKGYGKTTLTVTSPKTGNCNKVSMIVHLQVKGQPKQLKVSNLKKNKCTLSWTGNKLAKKYKIYKYNYKQKKYVKYGYTKNCSLKLTGLRSKTKYRFRIVAIDGQGNYGVKSENIVFTTKGSK